MGGKNLLQSFEQGDVVRIRFSARIPGLGTGSPPTEPLVEIPADLLCFVENGDEERGR
jgi:hypothetical protein